MSDITRAVAIRRGLRNLDGCTVSSYSDWHHAIELELGKAYNAGHIAGSGVKNQTDDEQHLAEVVRQLTNYQCVAIGAHISLELLDAIEKVRGPEPQQEPENFSIGDEL